MATKINLKKKKEDTLSQYRKLIEIYKDEQI